MESPLRSYLASKGARYEDDGSGAGPRDFGDVEKEYAALTTNAGLIDLSHRGRICLLGPDRAQFLHGQVTNHIKQLTPGQGCYAALVTAKGKIETDLNVYCLEEELLLDFEPGLTKKIQIRLEKYIIADDVQAVDVSPHFQMISAQGPKALQVLAAAKIQLPINPQIRSIFKLQFRGYEIYAAHLPRFGSEGWDLFIPRDQGVPFFQALNDALSSVGASWAGEEACNIARIEAGIPRFGVDMDETNLAPETGLEADAIHYQKGCYIGQEVIARIRTYGQVAKALRVLHFEGLSEPPLPKTKLLKGGRDAGYVTSSVYSPRHGKFVGLGYVRKETNKPGDKVELAGGTGTALVIGPPATAKVSQPK